MKIFDKGMQISHTQVQSIVPGRQASPIYHPDSTGSD
jgi:hypothetical protein